MTQSYTAKSTLFTTVALMTGAVLVAFTNMQAVMTMLTGA